MRGQAARRTLIAPTLVAWTVLGLGGCGRSAPPEPRSPDILVVVLDTLRADRASSNGYTRDTTPQLALLGQAGVVFEDVTAPGSWTWPSHASLFTGEPPWVHGAHLDRQAAGTERADGQLGMLPMRSDLPTLAEKLSAAGYRTVAAAANSHLRPELGLMRGFETVHVGSDNDIVAAVQAELAKPRDRPLFLFVNFMAAHGPWRETPATWVKERSPELHPDAVAPWAGPFLKTASSGQRTIDLYGPVPGDPKKTSGLDAYLMGQLEIPDRGMSLLSDLYDGMVVGSDYLLTLTVEAWKANRRDGVLLITSDHGEAFGEHGLLEHSHSVYAEVLKVPLVIVGPGYVEGGRRVREPVQLEDVYPTVLEWAGVPDSGYSLMRAMGGQPRPGPIQAASWSSARIPEGRLLHDWRYHRVGDEALVLGSDGTAELYDVGLDPGMTHDLSTERAERLDALRTEAMASFVVPAEAASSKPVELDPDHAGTIEALKALGYIEN